MLAGTVLLLWLSSLIYLCAEENDRSPRPSWLVNSPATFHERNHSVAHLVSVLDDAAAMKKFVDYSDYHLARVDGFVDGENVDSVEHFFWGATGGMAMELGALDGSPGTRSMTVGLESLGWQRILVEGSPVYRDSLRRNSPAAFSVNAAICEKHQKVHFAQVEYVGGIVEFMAPAFLAQYHKQIHDAGSPPGNLSSVDWTKFSAVAEIDCIPLALALHAAKVKHINLFILDVEGGEMSILKSIPWGTVRFDVICVETSPVDRPPGYAAEVSAFLRNVGYPNATGQVGRNMWFARSDFVPSARPGIASDCFNGARKSDREDTWWTNRRTPPFSRCPMP